MSRGLYVKGDDYYVVKFSDGRATVGRWATAPDAVFGAMRRFDYHKQAPANLGIQVRRLPQPKKSVSVAAYMRELQARYETR
jgi:hypothetical protein